MSSTGRFLQLLERAPGGAEPPANAPERPRPFCRCPYQREPLRGGRRRGQTPLTARWAGPSQGGTHMSAALKRVRPAKGCRLGAFWGAPYRRGPPLPLLFFDGRRARDQGRPCSPPAWGREWSFFWKTRFLGKYN
eukprot:gene2945-biopygen9655